MKQLHYTIQTLIRGRGAVVVKFVSLTLGLLVGVLLFAQIAYELSFDRFYPDPETLVTLRTRNVTKGVPEAEYNYGTYRPAAADLSEAMPELVESASLAVNFWQPTLYLEDKKLDAFPVIFADTAYFHTTGLQVLRGDPHDLAMMGNAFISQGKAKELFGDEDPVGKELSVDKVFNVTIRGVYADVPANTVYPHELMLSIPAADWAFGAGTWDMNNIYCVFFRLRRPEDVDAMNARVQKAVEQYTDTHLGDDVVTEYSVQPVYKVYRSFPDTTRRLVILGVLGFSIFFVSAMNYVLGAIASMSRRAKAIGVHKCNGASSWHILAMFLWETGLMIVAAIACAAALMYLFREQIGDLLGSNVADLFTWQTLYVPIILVLLLFVVAGFLPGRIYAKIPVTQVFRRYTESKRGWKRGLLFVQFVGVAFICGMLLTTVWQYHSLMQRSVGFHSDGLAVGIVTGSLNRAEGVADAIRREPYVEAVAASGNNLLSHYSTYRLTDNQGNFICPLHFMVIDKDFPQVTGMKLLEGEWPRHKGEAVVGKTTVETMKWDDTTLGRQLPIDPSWAGLDEPPIIVGVVDDVRNMGFFMEQTCTAFIQGDRLRCFNVRLKAPMDDNLRKLNAFVKATYPDLGLEFTTYQDIRAEQNESVSHFRNIVWVTTLCIVLIVLMGLIGYVSDETERRSKEIAVRKVNGAEARDILRLLSVDILKVSMLAVLIGIVFSWYVSKQWMQQFADSALPSSVWFALAAATLLALIVLVVIVRAWNIANENPVDSIKSE